MIKNDCVKEDLDGNREKGKYWVIDRLWGDGNVWDPAYKHGIVLQLAKEINCYWHRMRDVGIGGWCGLKVNGF